MGAVVRAQLMVLVLVRGVVVWWCSSSSTCLVRVWVLVARKSRRQAMQWPRVSKLQLGCPILEDGGGFGRAAAVSLADAVRVQCGCSDAVLSMQKEGH